MTQLYHGIRADLKPEDRIEPAGSADARNADGSGAHVHLSPDLDEAIWEAELSPGEGPARVYTVRPTGSVDVRPRSDATAPSHPVMSYRTADPLEVTGEVTEWRLYHGTRATLEVGDLIRPGHAANFGPRSRTANVVFCAQTLDAAARAPRRAISVRGSAASA